jgi:hypothetical protein
MHGEQKASALEAVWVHSQSMTPTMSKEVLTRMWSPLSSGCLRKNWPPDGTSSQRETVREVDVYRMVGVNLAAGYQCDV